MLFFPSQEKRFVIGLILGWESDKYPDSVKELQNNERHHNAWDFQKDVEVHYLELTEAKNMSEDFFRFWFFNIRYFQKIHLSFYINMSKLKGISLTTPYAQ